MCGVVVREAWATGCQQKGVAVCRFILSEDETTPQVWVLCTLHSCFLWALRRRRLATAQWLGQLAVRCLLLPCLWFSLVVVVCAKGTRR